MFELLCLVFITALLSLFFLYVAVRLVVRAYYRSKFEEEKDIYNGDQGQE